VNPSPSSSDPRTDTFHSRYDPGKEAERFAVRELKGKQPSLVILLGPGMPFLATALRSILPGARILAVQPDAGFDRHWAALPYPCWSPGSGQELLAFFDAQLYDGKAAGGVAILEWPPVMRAFPGWAGRIRTAAETALELLSSNAATSAYWARRWLRNAWRFSAAPRNLAELKPGQGVTLVACAGPSLEPVLPVLGERRQDVFVVALAAAHAALSRHGVIPDLLVSTDPGPWNALHVRLAQDGKVPLACAPGSFLPASILDGAGMLLPLDTALPFDELAAMAVGSRAFKAPSSGTAAGAALDIAASAGSGPVFIAGLDLAARSYLAHARPYALDHVDREYSSRVNPGTSQMVTSAFERYPQVSGSWRLSRAFDAYASGLRRNNAKRFFTLGRPGALPWCTAATQDDFAAALSAYGKSQRPALIPAPDPSADPARRFAVGLAQLAQSLKSSVAALASEPRHLDPDQVLALLALAGRDAAAVIADAARMRSDAERIQAALAAVDRGCASFAEADHA